MRIEALILEKVTLVKRTHELFEKDILMHEVQACNDSLIQVNEL
jgi:hypothetical protein